MKHTHIIYVRLPSQSLRRLRHSRCAILHPVPLHAPLTLLLSVKIPLLHSGNAADDRHVLCGLAQLL